MWHYRAFRIDQSGCVFDCINLVCDEAKSQAARLGKHHRIELWRLDKRLVRVEATPAPISIDTTPANRRTRSPGCAGYGA